MTLRTVEAHELPRPRVLKQTKGPAETAPTPDTAPIDLTEACRNCGLALGETPQPLCGGSHHWRLYAWRLEDIIDEATEGETSCDA